MIQGHFDLRGRPHVNAYIAIPDLLLTLKPITLLLDTGADRTSIQPSGATTLGINTRDLTPTGISIGIGGYARYATIPAFIAFEERPWPWRKTRLVYFRTELNIAMPDRSSRDLPSLLGRDIIDRCRILYDKAQGKLHLTPRLADGRMRL